MKRFLAIILLLFLLISACAVGAYAATSWGFGKTTTIDKTVLVDENDVRITATEMKFTSSGIVISLRLENNSNKKLSFVAGSMGYCVNSVNGYMIGSGYLNCDVEAHSSETDKITIYYSAFEAYGIADIADIELGFQISDDDYNRFYTGPRRITTSLYGDYDYSKNYYQEAVTGPIYKSNGITVESYTAEPVLSHEKISIKSWGMMTNKDGKSSLLVEVANESDALVYARTTNLSINNLLVYTGTVTSDAINPGATVVMTIPVSSILDETEWTMLGIEDVSNIGFEFYVNDEDGQNKVIENTELIYSTTSPDFSFDSSGIEVYNSEKLRVVYKTFAEGTSEYDDNLYAYFIIENKYGEPISIRASNEMLNGNKVSTSLWRSDIPDGKCVYSELEFYSYSFDDYGIVSASDVNTINATFQIRNTKYKTLDEIEITINTADGVVLVHDPWFCTACGQECNGGSGCIECGQERIAAQVCDSCDITYISADTINYCAGCGSSLN